MPRCLARLTEGPGPVTTTLETATGPVPLTSKAATMALPAPAAMALPAPAASILVSVAQLQPRTAGPLVTAVEVG